MLPRANSLGVYTSINQLMIRNEYFKKKKYATEPHTPTANKAVDILKFSKFSRPLKTHRYPSPPRRHRSRFRSRHYHHHYRLHLLRPSGPPPPLAATASSPSVFRRGCRAPPGSLSLRRNPKKREVQRLRGAKSNN